MTKEALMNRIRLKVKRCESQTRAAGSMDISAQYLNDVLTGKREPAGKLLLAMGVERVVTYRPLISSAQGD